MKIKRRRGSRFGHDVLVDGMLKDGLWDVYNDFPMGMCAELCSDQHSISREEQVVAVPMLYLRITTCYILPPSVPNYRSFCLL